MRNTLFFGKVKAFLGEQIAFECGTQKRMETQTDTDRRRREDREKDKKINHDGEIEMERS